MSSKLLTCTSIALRRFASSTCVTTASGTAIQSSVCPKEMELFKGMSSSWWDEKGIVRLLNSMTPVRVELLQDSLTNAGLINTDEVDIRTPFQNLNILDVGCGGGFLAEAVAKLGGKVTGIDASIDLIKVAKEHMLLTPKLDENLNYKNVTVEEFAMDNKEKFDVIISSEVIEHVLDKEMFAENALKCLRPGGSAFFTTMNRTLISGFYYIYLCEDVLNCIPKGAHEYNKFMRPNEMADLFRKYNCIATNVSGFTMNAISGKWFKVGFPHLNFALHATKQQNFH